MKQLLLKIHFTVMLLLVTCVAMAAKDVEFEVNAPLLVSVGEPFPVEFKLNAKPDGDTFKAPEFKGLTLIAGPRISNGTSIQIINGDMTRSVNYTYTYILIAESADNFTIGSASVDVDKKQYTTQPTAIEAVAGHNTQSESNNREESTQRTASNRVAQDDLVLRVDLSRKSVFKGEPIYATVKLYSRVDIVNNENMKLPTFNGFWAQDITSDRSQRVQRERLNGKVYDTHTIREYLLYPQQSGELTIDPASIDIIAQVVVQSRNIDPFFGGGHEFYNVRRHLETSPVKIDVKRLPAGAPASFSGAVGKYNIELVPPESSVIKANSAATLRLRISGSGNLSFVQAPKFSMPNSFEQYNVRTTESLSNSTQGTMGYKEFEYPFIARAEGDYTIPAVEFSYFDPESNAYRLLTTNPFSMTITRDEDGGGAAKIERGVSKMDIEMLGSDIRFIKLGGANFASKSDPLILSWLYYLILIAVVAIYVALFIYLKRAIRDSKNIALRKGKRANKVAVQRFKVAKRAMDESNERLFYEEMLRGLWGYMSDKLNIPVADLTKEYVREELSKRGVSSEVAQAFGSIISRCDEAQYSPAASSQMSEVYGEGLQLLSQIETLFKRK